MTDPIRAPVSQSGSTTPPGEQTSERRPRVLILDDEPMITTILRRLIGNDCDIHISHSARETRDQIRGGARFDVILCDLMMPDITGIDLHADVERVAPDQAAKMIFMTGGAFTESSREFLERVPNPRIEKPFAAAGVKAAMQRVLGR